jgi:hypothetical protein
MGKPIATKKTGGICFAFPDVCYTPSPSGQVPVPYPNIAQLSGANPVAETVKAVGNPVITEQSKISTSTGDEAGTLGGVANGGQLPGGETIFASFSNSVKAEGKFVVRMFDSTKQNNENAVGQVLGGEATVLVGG